MIKSPQYLSITLIAFLTAILVSSCSDDKKNPVSNSDGGDETAFTFPYNIANSWSYRATITEANPDDLSDVRSFEVDVEWTVTSLVVTPTVETFSIESISTVTSGEYIDYEIVTNIFYAVEADTLKTIFREGDNPWGTILHKSASPAAQEEYQSWELTVLITPFTLDQAWQFSRSSSDLGIKRVISFNDVKTVAGTHKAYKVMRELPTYSASTWFSSVGVVKKTTEVWHESEKDSDGNPLTVFSMEMELVDYTVRR